MIGKISYTLLIFGIFSLSGCYTVGDKTSRVVNSVTEDLLPSEKWYTQSLISESIKLALDGHYYNRLGEALVK